MKRFVIAFAAVAVVLALYWVPAGRSERGPSFNDFQMPPLQVAAGFEIELVAAPPLVQYPVMAGFDEQGRLFVAENAGVNLDEKELEAQRPSLIRVLEDTNGDGLFDHSSVFADRMTFPQGALWHEGALYAASPPSMWRLADTTGDGVADLREELSTGFEYTGNAADIHGPFLSPEGRLFWCHGRKGHEVYEGDRLVSKGRAARIWTARPDGGDVQVFAGGGMDNPTELAFTDEGDVFGTVPLFYNGPRGDVVVHWIYGGVYPRSDQEQVLAEFKRTGDLLSHVVNLGHVAPSGIVRYRSPQFGEAYRDNLFVAEFNTHRIMRVILEREGSTFRGHSEVFLSSSSPDVHFTDLVEDADGSLLVIDTGGWFRRGCPTSGVAKPNVQGAIYRIRRQGAPAVADPRGLKLDWASSPVQRLAARLGDERFAVRDRAVSELARRGDEAVPELERTLQQGERQARLQAVWTLTRINTEVSRRAVRSAFQDQDAGVRQAASRSVFTTRDAAAAAQVTQLLRDVEPAVQREAAAAVGRLKQESSVEPLLSALAAAGEDAKLQHALIFALIEIDRPGATAVGLADRRPEIKRGALIALSQMDSGRLNPQQVIPWLDSDDAGLRKAALMVVQGMPEWREPVSAVLSQWLGRATLQPHQDDTIRQLIARFAGESAVQELVGRLLARPDLTRERRQLVLAALAQSPGLQMDASWVPSLKRLLASGDAEGIQAAIRVIRASRASEFDEDLQRIGSDDAGDPLLRVAALQAVSGQGGELADSSFELLSRLFGGGETVGLRVQSAQMLAEARLSSEQLLRLSPLVASAGPLELQALAPVFRRSQDEEVGEEVGKALIGAISQSPGLFSLTAGDIRRSFGGYPAAVVDQAEELVAQLVQRDRSMESHLAQLEAGLERGDAERGRQAYFSGKGECVLCHSIQGTGGEVGPDLSTIGRSRSAHELLDKIVYPNESGFARGYESYNITTRDGQSYFGTVPRETPDSIYVVQVASQPVPVPRDQIETMEPSPVSLMPSGLDRLVTEQELADLVSFLRSLK